MEVREIAWKGVYTVEAAWVFSICLFIIAGTIGMTFRIYEETHDYVTETREEKVNAPKLFREIQMGKGLAQKALGEE